jgi:hypothetical protein
MDFQIKTNALCAVNYTNSVELVAVVMRNPFSPASRMQYDEISHLRVDAAKLGLHMESHRIALYELLVRTVPVGGEGNW